MPTMNNIFLIQIGGPVKSKYGMRAKASSANNCRGAPTQ